MPNGQYSHSNKNSLAVLLRLRRLMRLLISASILLVTLNILAIAQTEVPLINVPSTPLDLRQHKNLIMPGQLTQQDYIISQDDDLDIYVLDVVELSRVYRVSPRGTITVPLLPEPITASGLTPDQLAKEISDQLRRTGMVDQAHVTVRVKESRLHSIAIAGAVKKPQIYPILGKTTLLDAISQAEGLALDAGNTAIITRGDIGTRQTQAVQTAESTAENPLLTSRTIQVDLKRLLEYGDSSQNFDLYPGDRVTVQRAGIIYVVGAVNRAGGFVLDNDREQMTVLKAIAMANNITPVAASKNAVIIRGGQKGGGGSQEIPVELDKILKHHAKDRVLVANDILFVPESSRKKAMIRATEVASQAAIVSIYRF